MNDTDLKNAIADLDKKSAEFDTDTNKLITELRSGVDDLEKSLVPLTMDVMTAVKQGQQDIASLAEKL